MKYVSGLFPFLVTETKQVKILTGIMCILFAVITFSENGKVRFLMIQLIYLK